MVCALGVAFLCFSPGLELRILPRVLGPSSMVQGFQTGLGFRVLGC